MKKLFLLLLLLAVQAEAVTFVNATGTAIYVRVKYLADNGNTADGLFPEFAIPSSGFLVVSVPKPVTGNWQTQLVTYDLSGNLLQGDHFIGYLDSATDGVATWTGSSWAAQVWQVGPSVLAEEDLQAFLNGFWFGIETGVFALLVWLARSMRPGHTPLA